MHRIWWDNDSYYGDDPAEILWVHDGQVLLRHYLDDLELGIRASDYFDVQIGLGDV